MRVNKSQPSNYLPLNLKFQTRFVLDNARLNQRQSKYYFVDRIGVSGVI